MTVSMVILFGLNYLKFGRSALLKLVSVAYVERKEAVQVADGLLIRHVTVGGRHDL